MGSRYDGMSHLEMYLKKIKQEGGYLGPYPHIVEPGKEQHMIFQDDDGGPLWMTPEEREAKRCSQLDETTNVVKTNSNLL